MRGMLSYHPYDEQTSRKPLPYDTPATYQIVVLGQIDLTWSDCLEGMICQVIVEADAPGHHLEGELYDQADLARCAQHTL